MDLGNIGDNLCFGGSLLAVLAPGKTVTQLMQDTRQLYDELCITPQQKLTLTDVSIFESHLHVNIGVVIHGNKGWGIFRTGPPIYPKSCFLLLHDDHYYGILNMKGFFGRKNYALCVEMLIPIRTTARIAAVYVWNPSVHQAKHNAVTLVNY